ncbi:MAG: glycosyltransferase family 2 protein [Fimbriimonadales bacterium]|nr:glycosyltransferase family 2 protein [Fimbriimonadales bacterium]
MADLELTVTICSWNTAADLRACLQSLQDRRHEARFEVIVVDNASSDGSPDMVEAEFPWVRLERMDRNLGFTKGHNHALRLRRAPHAFVLNSDTVVHPGCLRGLLDYLADHPECGILGPKLLNTDGSLQMSCRRFPNPVAALFRNTPIGRLFPNNRFTREYLMMDWDHSTPREVDWVSGAAFMVSRRVLEEVGLFDEGFFMFCEDVDWCWRVWRAGMKVVYVPHCLVTHAIGRSTDKAANRMIVLFHGSMLRFYRKNMVPSMHPLLRFPAVALAAAALAARASVFILKNWKDEVVRRLRR